jgi:phytoene synthase
MMQLFHQLCNECSKLTTEKYSTSFSGAILLLQPQVRKPIYNIYGFVRLADEIVDTFHDYDKAALLADFKRQTFEAIESGISLNPLLHSFQQTVNEFKIDPALIHSFFKSMEMDLHQSRYNLEEFREYIYGSAEVVGLICLYVFCNGNKDEFVKLQPYASALGAAFQKINFLRDSRADYQELKRTYFPGVDFTNFTSKLKDQIENDITADLRKAYEGIVQLPLSVRYGVYLAYRYYATLFEKIKRTEPNLLLSERIRIPDYHKAFIFLRAGVKSQLKII